jgi:outer membrane protein OmpA-like peptidoglycan-associated protein
MKQNRTTLWTGILALGLIVVIAGCASLKQQYTTHDKTKKGAAIGAGAGAAAAILAGERELDEVLLGAAIGAGVGAGVGAYMDNQEEKLGEIPGTTVERVSDDVLLVNFESDVLFEVGSSLLNPESRSVLDQAASVFLEYPKTAILAQGHTDSAGSEEYNQDLSEKRAKAVMNHLIARGVDADRITAVGYGEGYPVADNGTPSGRSLNRRVDLLLKAKAK